MFEELLEVTNESEFFNFIQCIDGDMYEDQHGSPSVYSRHYFSIVGYDVVVKTIGNNSWDEDESGSTKVNIHDLYEMFEENFLDIDTLDVDFCIDDYFLFGMYLFEEEKGNNDILSEVLVKLMNL